MTPTLNKEILFQRMKLLDNDIKDLQGLLQQVTKKLYVLVEAHHEISHILHDLEHVSSSQTTGSYLLTTLPAADNTNH